MSQTIRVALAEDHPVVREGLEMLFAKADGLDIVISAGDGASLLKQLAEQGADVVLLDHGMPTMDGMKTLHHIQEDFPDLKVIVLTMENDPTLIVKYLTNGAFGYLLKGENSATIFETLRKAHNGERRLPDYATEALVNNARNQKSKKDGAPELNPENEFTNREEEILKIIGKMDRQGLAATFGISIKGIDYHLKNLRIKTGCVSTPELVRWAIRNEYQKP